MQYTSEQQREPSVTFNERERGYERILHHYDGTEQVRLHRLIAVAEYGYDAVVGKEVHHSNDIPWDNRPENIEPLTTAEHSKITAEEMMDQRERDENGQFVSS